MFKKPTCPYCKAIYTSDEIKKQYNNEKVKCHNCKKVFVVKKNIKFEHSFSRFKPQETFMQQALYCSKMKKYFSWKF